ncbi:MAG TPA: alpha/beta hydrolase [Vicinamibacterales bacterium]|nr:alpha/beta hydrolase [Vicinamibacterales bacterium]
MKASSSISPRLWLARAILGLVPNKYVDVDKLKALMAGRKPPKDADPPGWFSSCCHVRRWTAGGHAVITVTPRSGPVDWNLMYLHGGGYIFPLMRPHWTIIRALIEATGAAVTVPLYPLAPEHDHRPAWAMIDAVYEELLHASAGKPLALAGDSAGANFALSLAIRRRSAGASLPDRLILFSPWLDLTLSDPATRQVEPRDGILAVDGAIQCGRWWVAEKDPLLPEFSPLHADLAGLPAMAVFQGTHDIFVVDARSFAARATAHGADLQYFEYEGGFHVFMGARSTRESRDVYRRVAEFLAARTV